MKKFLLLLLLAIQWTESPAQLADYSASIKVTWPRDPGCYRGSIRGPLRIVDNNVVADNGSKIRGAIAFVLPDWSQCWNHWLDTNTYKDMADKRRYNAVRATFYQKGQFVSAENQANILDIDQAKLRARQIVDVCKRMGFYCFIEYRCGYGYGAPLQNGDTVYIRKWWEAIASELKDDKNVGFILMDEPHSRPKDYSQKTIDLNERLEGICHRINSEAMVIVFEVAGCTITSGDRTPKQLADLASGIDWGRTAFGWHAYPTLKGSNIWPYWDELRANYPQMMTAFSADQQFGPNMCGAWNFGCWVDSLEAHDADWFELKGFPWHDPHVPISGTISRESMVPPASPSLDAPSDGSSERASLVRFSWRAVTGATSYRLQVGANASMAQVILDRPGLTSLTSSAEGLAEDSVFYWRVAASNLAGAGAWSPVRRFTTAAGAAAAKNLVSNPDFSTGTAGWTFHTNGAGSMQEVTPGFDDSQAVSLTITQSGSNVQLFQSNVALDASLYRLSFAAYSNSGHGLDVILQQHGSPYANYGLSKHIALSSDWSVYSVEFVGTPSAAVSDGRLMFWLASSAVAGDQYWIDRVVLEKMGAAASNPTDETPGGYALQQNYPNPFNPTTTIQYTLPQRSQARLTVFNLLGQQVAELVNGDLEAGYHEIRFDGSGLSSGMYLYRLAAGDFVQTKKLVITK